MDAKQRRELNRIINAPELDVIVQLDGTCKPNPHAKALGKLGGKVKSEAKAAAARENGKKGGRPKQARNIS